MGLAKAKSREQWIFPYFLIRTEKDQIDVFCELFVSI